jgi:hypothetical protein
MTTKLIEFPNIGFLQHVFDENSLIPLRKEVENIQKNFNLAKSASDKLIGNIKKEFDIIDSKVYLENLLIPFISVFDQKFDYLRNLNILTNSLPITLDQIWVNFQEKFEFNPNHNHSGFMSFVIWLDIPFLIDDERKNSPGKYSSENLSGNFQFTYMNTIGNARNYNIPVDISYKNTMIMFPSKFVHCVYPFYSSDNHRVSVSGNFYLKS